MSKLVLSNLVNFTNEVTAIGTLAANNNAIVAAFDNTLSRDGSNPNQMNASLDMNSHRILNLPSPVSSDEPLRLSDFNTRLGAFASVSGTLSLPAVTTVGNIAFFTTVNGRALGAVPAYQATNPARAALYTHIDNPVIDGTIYNFAQFSVGTPVTEVNQFGGDAFSINHGLVATMDIPAGSTIIQGAALAGYAVVRSATNSVAGTPPGAIGLYAQAATAIAGGNAFASNFTAHNAFNFGTKAAPNFQAFNANFICSNECDVGVYQTSPGVDPTINGVDGGSAIAYYASGGGDYTGVIGTGFVCGQASVNGGRRAWGFRTEDGVTRGGLLIGAATGGNNTGSQTLTLRGRNNSGVEQLATLTCDAAGILSVVSPVDTYNFGAWTVFTPASIAPETGALTGATVTATGKYKKIGKTIICQIIVTVTAIGSGTPGGNINVALPFAATTAAGSTYIGSSYESVIAGNGGVASVLGNFSATLMNIKNISAATYWVNGYVVTGQVTYEIP